MPSLFCTQTPICNGTKRTKRETDSDDDGLPATIEVFSGLYVNEQAEVIDDDYDSVSKEKVINQRSIIIKLCFVIIEVLKKKF